MSKRDRDNITIVTTSKKQKSYDKRRSYQEFYQRRRMQIEQRQPVCNKVGWLCAADKLQHLHRTEDREKDCVQRHEIQPYNV